MTGQIGISVVGHTGTPAINHDLVREWIAPEILGPFNLNQHGPPLLVGVSLLFRLDHPIPYLFSNRPRIMQSGGPIKPCNPP